MLDLNSTALSAAQRAHTENCAMRIRQEIERHGGCIGFDRYMQLALYDPSTGYYHRKPQIFGRDGDFSTVPEISVHLAYCLAHACARLIRDDERRAILEVGAGSGRLARDIIRFLHAWGRPPSRYCIYEPSDLLRVQQRKLLAAEIPQYAETVKWWFPNLSTNMESAIIIVNEVLDALPVKCFEVLSKEPKEKCVGLTRQGAFEWQLRSPSSDLEAALNDIAVTLEQPFPEGYRSEVNLDFESALFAWTTGCEQCVMFLIDYGYPRSEYYHPQRNMGTLRSYFNHQVSESPLIRSGLQDFTADVDFSALAKAAECLNLKVLSFGSQRNFMLANHLLDWRPQGDNEIDRITQVAQLKQLTLGAAIGERFQVMVLGKGIEYGEDCFTLRDMRARL